MKKLFILFFCLLVISINMELTYLIPLVQCSLLIIGGVIYYNKVYKINNPKTINDVYKEAEIVPKCVNCGSELNVNNKYCENCKKLSTGDNIKLETPLKEVYLTINDFSPNLALSDDNLVERFIDNELVKAGIDKNIKLIPFDSLKRKKIFNIIFAVLVFIYIVLIFFHFPILTYIIGFGLLVLFFKLTRSYNLMKYLIKEVKSRPSEKISNIVMNVKTRLIKDDSYKTLLFGLLVAVISPLIIFNKPIILYEKIDGGYAVRYYLFGITNYTTVTIPETYNNEKVISLRGNAFSNMPFLTNVILPDSITEIRGQAFKNDIKLVSVKLPNNLNYLGGGAFYNCISLKNIEIPDSVTYLGGESFYNAISLESVKLSSNITEIRGSTFENCSSLKSIDITDNVTRIGGHAFYGNTFLSNVNISRKSKLNEIGSSAFRLCSSLYEITLPSNVYVNQRAFKESPTVIKYYIDNEY